MQGEKKSGTTGLKWKKDTLFRRFLKSYIWFLKKKKNRKLCKGQRYSKNLSKQKKLKYNFTPLFTWKK